MAAKTTQLALLLAFTAIALSGCVSARYVEKGPDYGVVAISSDSNSWPFKYRDEAEKKMAEHFPEGYEIVREEEVVVGQQTHTDRDQERNEAEIIDGFLTATTTEERTTKTTTDVTEWRIHYRRLGAPRAAMGPPPQPRR